MICFKFPDHIKDQPQYLKYRIIAEHKSNTLSLLEIWAAIFICNWQMDRKLWKVDLKWTNAGLCNWQTDKWTENHRGLYWRQTKPQTHRECSYNIGWYFSQQVRKSLAFFIQLQSPNTALLHRIHCRSSWTVPVSGKHSIDPVLGGRVWSR